MAGQVFEFDEPDRFLFGRDPVSRCALPDDPFVSSNHFLIDVAPPQIKLHELGSKNGTFVNDVRYGGRKAPAPGVKQADETDVQLRHGDRIRVGETEIVVEIRSEAETDPDPAERQHAETQCHSSGRLPSFSDPVLAELDPEELPTVDPSGHPPAPADPANPMEKLFAELLPRYQPIRLLGEGGMGKVFLARDRERGGEEVAVKLIRPRGGPSKAAIDLFLRETDLTRQLRHPNVVRYVGAGHFGDDLYLVLEYVEGEDLAALYAREGPLPLRQAGPLMVCALHGLGYAHRVTLETEVTEGGRRQRRSFSGLVHRDLKPENILIGGVGKGRRVPKIADLGLAKVYGAAGMSDFTEPGAVAGTPFYWPREQLTDYRFLKPAADVFAMGAILYRLLSGKFARPGLNKPRLSFHQVCLTVLREDVRPIRELLPELPQGVAAVIMRSLANDAISRYEDGAEMAVALREALDASGAGPRRRAQA